jgi:hypothetical protein
MNKSKKITFYVCAGIIVVFLYFKYGIVTMCFPSRGAPTPWGVGGGRRPHATFFIISSRNAAGVLKPHFVCSLRVL